MDVSLPLPGGRLERGMVRLGVRDHVARLLAATPSLRASWLIAGAVVIGCSASAASTGPRGMLVFLVVAPLVPLAGVAAAYGPWMDPMHEVARATPTPGLRILLIRATAVLVSAGVIVAAAALVLPNADWRAGAWVLPSLALVVACLALSTFVPVPWAAGGITVSWLTVVVVAAARSGDRFAVFHGLGQASFFLVVVISSVVLAWRRERVEVEGRVRQQHLIDVADSERRRIERNIHDGAQQQLVAISVKLGLARTMVARDPASVDELLMQLQIDAQEALDNLRDMTRGTYPPVLADEGLAAALESKTRKLPFRVVVDAGGVGRYPRELETAVYYCCLEALQNASKYAKPSRATVSVRYVGGELAFSISDDGAGFDPDTAPKGVGMRSMAERVETLGGTFEVRSAPGAGTVIMGRIPQAAWMGG